MMFGDRLLGIYTDSLPNVNLFQDEVFCQIFPTVLKCEHLIHALLAQMDAHTSKIIENVSYLRTGRFVYQTKDELDAELNSENNSEDNSEVTASNSSRHLRTLSLNKFNMLFDPVQGPQLCENRDKLLTSIEKELQAISNIDKTYRGVWKIVYVLDSIIHRNFNWESRFRHVEKFAITSSTSGVQGLSLQVVDRGVFFKNILL